MGATILRRRWSALGIATVALAAMLVGCAPTGTVEIDVPAQVEGDFPAETQSQLDAALAEAMAATGSSGAIVGVWAPWSGSWVAGVGTQSPTSSQAVTSDMEFRASRVTRAMTCDVLYALVDREVVALEDNVSEYVGGASGLEDVTLGQLCDSTSGIGASAPSLWNDWLKTPNRQWPPLELAAYGMGRERTSSPGAAFVDSDAGYFLLGVALETATTTSLPELFEQYVTDPLGLDSTWLPDSAPATPAGDTGAPSLQGNNSLPGEEGQLQCADPLEITELSASIGFADSGAVSTIADLGRYAQALATGALLGDDQTRFDSPREAYPGAPTWYTYDGGAFAAGGLIGQHGAIPGYLTAAYADPDTGLTVAVVLNNSAAPAGIAANLAWELAAIASKAPAAAGETAPPAGLPWTAEQQAEAIRGAAVCPLPQQ